MDLKAVNARIMHHRHGPKRNFFNYRAFYMYFQAGYLDVDPVRKDFLGFNCFNLLSYCSSDYGFRNQSATSEWLNSILTSECLAQQVKQVFILSMPKMLGYVFNPVSFWCCFDEQKNMVAVIAEVSNTFGERHSYCCHMAHADAEGWVTAKKVFHVSPFFSMDGFYRFNFKFSDSEFKIKINLFHDQQLMLSTAITGTFADFKIYNFFQALSLSIFSVFKVFSLILFQALRLWLKGLTIYQKPLKLAKFYTQSQAED